MTITTLRTRTNQVFQQSLQQRPALQSQTQNEQSRLSDELLEEVGRTTPGNENLEAMLNAVTQNFLDRKVEESEPARGKQMEVEWAPEVRPGELMAPQGYTGQLIYKESKTENVQAPGKVGKSGAGTPSNTKKAAGKSDDKVELTAESQKMSQKMQQSGMKPGGGTNPTDKPGCTKAEERVDVFMPATGVTQLVDVTRAGKLGADGLLGTYRKLDDMPSWNGAILRKRTGKEMVEEFDAKRARGEKVEPLTEDQQQKLKNPIATEK